jgi:predicted AAA+ superfamily ATPase
MWFKRKANSFLLKWKEKKNRKPLVLRGARQVGKTTIVKMFSKTYDQSLFLNLEKEQDANYFRTYSDVKTLVEALWLQANLQDGKKKQILLFIDEIQEEPKAIHMLRYFYEEFPELHVIAAGSLLEQSLNKVKSFPVGRVQFLYIHPLNFLEFLEANNRRSLIAGLNKVPVSKAVHHNAMDWFHKYALVGGMPEVVQEYVDDRNILDLPSIYESIWATYREDVVKYAGNRNEERVIKHIMETAPLYLDKRVTYHGFGSSNYKSREVRSCFRALDEAKVIQLIHPSTSVEPPIITDFKKSPRMQFLDTGILNHALDLFPHLLSVEDLSTTYKGALLPHIITQELISLQEEQFEKPKFWVRQKKGAQAEVDLLYPYRELVIPIEIKSGKVGKLRSLHQFIERSPHPYAIRMYAGLFSIEKHKTPRGKPFVLINLPYYLTSQLDSYLDYATNKF